MADVAGNMESGSGGEGSKGGEVREGGNGVALSVRIVTIDECMVYPSSFDHLFSSFHGVAHKQVCTFRLRYKDNFHPHLAITPAFILLLR